VRLWFSEPYGASSVLYVGVLPFGKSGQKVATTVVTITEKQMIVKIPSERSCKKTKSVKTAIQRNRNEILKPKEVHTNK
jgi:hypothetical protein